MANSIPTFRSAFVGPEDEFSGLGKRPVVFDVLAPDLETSLLPGGIKLVLHVNPSSMKFSYSKIIERIQTKGGFVEQHFGEGVDSISFEASSGGFMRLYSGLIGTTGGPNSLNIGGTRRDTIAYDKYLDFLALFHNNGLIYDSRGNIIFHGAIKCMFDGGVWIGWFSSFSLSEDAEKPYQFTMSADFTIDTEILSLRTTTGRPSEASSAATLADQELNSALTLAREREALLTEEETTTSGWVLDG